MLETQLTSVFFPAKLLLFGEYTVLRGGAALAIPLQQFGGKWCYDKNALEKQYSLYDFCEYLKNDRLFPAFFAKKAAFLQSQLSEGLYFDANIPRGYGAGSSGAVTAAVFFALGGDATMPLTTLKNLLGRMESFFHGASSGLDPLVSCVQNNLLLLPNTPPQIVALPPPSVGAPFLIDTHRPRKTEPLVQLFFEKLKPENQIKNIDFQKNIDNELMPNVENALQAMLKGDAENLWKAVEKISYWQFHLLRDMIPLPFQNIWQQGFESGDLFRLKLCGAGGGGFLLGFSQRPKMAQAFLRQHGFSVVPII